MTWPTGVQPFGKNHAPLLTGLSSVDGVTAVPVAVDPTDGAIEVNIDSVSVALITTNANLYTGQKTVNTTAVQVSITSHSLSNGIIIKAPSTNSAAIYVGVLGVTTANGDMLEPGESKGYAVNNSNIPYIISVASTTDIVTWSAN